MEKKFIVNSQEIVVQDFQKSGNKVEFTLQGKRYNFELVARDSRELIIQGEKRYKANIGTANKDGDSIVMASGREVSISAGNKKLRKSGGGAGSLTSPMPGKIFKIVKEIGASVAKGETILILEAMKMEHSIRADKDGKVKKILFKTGDLVQGGVTLAEVE